MPGAINLLVFTIEDTSLAVYLDQVERVVRAATLKPVPGAPASVLGLLDLHGVPVPVISLRRQLKMTDREIATTDEIIIIKQQAALLGLLVDEVERVAQVKDIAPLPEAAQLSNFKGALRIQDNLVLVHNLDKFLSSEDEFDLALALFRSTIE